MLHCGESRREDDRVTGLRVSDEVREAVDAGAPGARARIDDLHPRTPPADATSRSRSEAEERVRDARRRARDDRRGRRRADGRALARARSSGCRTRTAWSRRACAISPVAAVKGLSAGTTVAATAHLAHRAGVQGVLDRWSRRRASRRTADVRRVRRPRHPRLPPPRRRQRRRQVDPRHPAHPRAPRDAQPRGGRLPHDRLPGLLHRRLRARHRVRGRTPPPRSPRSRAPAMRSASPRRCSSPTRWPPSASCRPSCTTRCSRAPSRRAEAQGVGGHDTTPFLLDFIQRETGGRSLDVNVDVYRGNVALGAEIAARPRGRR